MLQLSDRLLALAGGVRPGDVVADIGTDHGKVPLYLFLNGVTDRLILTDVRPGPLDKARQNIALYAPSLQADLRIGNGLEPILGTPVDTVIVAGMGGRLIRMILEAQPEATAKIRRLILQPRNAPDALRAYLHAAGIPVIREQLVREGRFFCEIITAAPGSDAPMPAYGGLLDYEISPLLFIDKDPLLAAFLANKRRIDAGILSEVEAFGGPDASARKATISARLRELDRLIEESGQEIDTHGTEQEVRS